MMYCASAGANFLMCAGIGNTDLKAKPKPEIAPSGKEAKEARETQEDVPVEADTAKVKADGEKKAKHEVAS
jgi:hypothetical protein